MPSVDIDLTRTGNGISVNLVQGDGATVTEAATLNGVTVSGTPSDGQVLTATSATTATWEDSAGGTSSVGGNGAADSGKLVEFNHDGGIKCSTQLEIYGSELWSVAPDEVATFVLSFPVLAGGDDQTVTFPARTGTVVLDTDPDFIANAEDIAAIESSLPGYASLTGSYADPSWITSLAKSKVGLGSVENAAASTLYVPLTRTVNGSALSSNVTITTITGNAGTATALQTARTINGVSFDGTANITISAAAAADTLTGSTLASGVTASSLTSVGTIATGTWDATAIADGKIASALTGKTYNGLTVTSTTGTLTIASGKTVTASNTITLAGTDGTTMTFPSTNATIARTDAAQTFVGVQSFSPAGTLRAQITSSGWFSARNIVALSVDKIGWQSGTSVGEVAPDAFLMRGGAAATIQAGETHATAATAQTIKAHNVTTGTGASLTLAGGTGSVAGGVVNLSASVTTGAPVARITVGATGIALFGGTERAQPARAGQLTDSTGATADTTCVDVTTAGLADPAKINANFADIIAKYNALESKISAAGTGIGVTA